MSGSALIKGEDTKQDDCQTRDPSRLLLRPCIAGDYDYVGQVWYLRGCKYTYTSPLVRN